MKNLYTLLFLTIITIGMNGTPGYTETQSPSDYSNYLVSFGFSPDTISDNLLDNEPFEILNLIAYQEGVLIDIDKNSYKSVKIGNQVWMAENLITSRLNDGTTIPLVADNTIWSNLLSPGYCWYNNDEAIYKKPQGALYNLYAVNTGKLCPSGWHLPTDDEWETLGKYLINNSYNYDGSMDGNKIGKALSSTTLWTTSTIAGTVGNVDFPDKRNVTGFGAYPGGYRCYCGTFYGVGNYGYWWSATNSDASNAWFRYLGYGNSDLLRDNSSKLQGGGKTAFSVRCLKDK